MPSAWLLVAGLAIAPPVELRWHAPPECPQQVEVVDRLAAYRDEVDDALPVRVVEADVRALADGTWELALRFDGSSEPRVLTHATCSALADAAIVVVAIAVAPPGEPAADPPDDPPPSRELPPEQEPRPSTSDPPPVAPNKRTGGRADRRGTTPIGLAIGLGAGVGAGAMPVGFSLAPALAIVGARWRAAVVGLFESRRRLRLPELEGSGSDLVHWAVGAEGCWLPRVARFLEIPVCGGAEAGELVATGFGLDNDRRRRSPWIAMTATAGLRFVVHPRVVLWLAPTAVITLTPTRVVVGGEQSPLFRTWPVGVRGLGGLEIKVW